MDFSQQADDYKRIEKSIQYIEDNFKSRPSLDQIADHVHLSKYHFARLFKRWAGISPMLFLQYLTIGHTKEMLSERKSLLETSINAGLSGPGRLHDLFVKFEAMPPGEFKSMGAGVQIEYGFSGTPFGQCLLAMTSRGICHLGFVCGDNQSEALKQLQHSWPGAVLEENPPLIHSMLSQIFNKGSRTDSRPFHLHLKGTNFQVQVWRALLTIPSGYLVSYQDIAFDIGRPKSFRAVAGAIASNPVGYLIPCHRVIAKSGKIHQYRWGSVRKKAMIGWEISRNH